MTPKSCVAAVLDALAATASPSPALEEAIAALKVRHNACRPAPPPLFLHSQRRLAVPHLTLSAVGAGRG